MAGYTGPLAALPARFAATTSSGAPVSGRYEVGDYAIDATGAVFVCIVAGAPGTWVANPVAPVTDASKLPLAGGTMSGAIAMGSNKITGLANGSAADDAAAFGQIPTALPPDGSAGGDLAGSYPNPTLATGIVTAGTTGDSTHWPVITVDAKGRTTAVTSQVAPTLSSLGGLSASAPAATGKGTADQWIPNNHAVTVSANAATVPVTFQLTTVTNNAAATVTITITTAGAVDGQPLIVRFYDFSAVAQTLAWTNTENSQATAPTTSNGSTTSPLTVGFMYNSATSKWRCIAVA